MSAIGVVAGDWGWGWGWGRWYESGVVDGGDGDGSRAAELEAYETLGLHFSRSREINLRV